MSKKKSAKRDKAKAKSKDKGHGGKGKMPKRKCCVSKPRCKRCPIEALKNGTLPPGYTVKRRHLVKIG